MLEYIDRAFEYTAIGRDEFDADRRTQDAVVRCLTVIGEAAGVLSPATYEQIGSLPPHLPRGQRNLLVHEHWKIDLDTVWTTVERDLAAVRADIEALRAGQ